MASAYQVLDDLHYASNPPLVREFPSLPLILNYWAPTIVVILSLQLLLDMFHFRENLFKRNVIVNLKGSSCILCVEWIELASHLFVTCNLSSCVWYKIFRWLGFQFVIPSDIRIIFEVFISLGVNSKFRKVFFHDLTCCCMVHLISME